MDIKFLTQENEIQKLYSKFGLVVPVGDLETGKAPAIQPLPSTSTQTSITFNYNIISGSDVYMISAGVWRWEDVAEEYDPENQNPDPVCPGSDYGCTPPLQYFDIPAQKGVISIEVTDLEYNSGPYLIGMLVENESGSITIYGKADLQPYTNWATADEVLEGNKFIGEDGQEAVGTYVAPGPTDGGAVVESAYVINDGGYEFHVSFTTMPNLDPVNHTYTGMLLAYCNGDYGSVFTGKSTYQNITGIVTTFRIDSVNSEITFFDVYAPTDSSGNELLEANGYILIFEDGYDNLKYKIPCTIVNTTIS